MQMRPDDFWGQTVREWDARIAGYRKANGAGKDDSLTEEDIAELHDLIEDEP